MENDLIMDKKECPKCGSKNVQYLVTDGGGSRFVEDGGRLPSIEYHDFECRECGTVFHYYGEL